MLNKIQDYGGSGGCGDDLQGATEIVDRAVENGGRIAHPPSRPDSEPEPHDVLKLRVRVGAILQTGVSIWHDASSKKTFTCTGAGTAAGHLRFHGRRSNLLGCPFAFQKQADTRLRSEAGEEPMRSWQYWPRRLQMRQGHAAGAHPVGMRTRARRSAALRLRDDTRSVDVAMTKAKA